MFNLSNYIDFFTEFLSALGKLWDYFNTPLLSVLESLNFLFPSFLFDGFLSSLGILDFTFLELGFSFGLTLFISLRFIKFVLSFIPFLY